MDRRSIFFLCAAVICGALTFVIDELQWVTIGLAILYVLFALGSWLDYRSRTRED